MINKSILLPLFLLFSIDLSAQKTPIDHSVYDTWKNISDATISPSGRYVYYSVASQEGNGYIELKDNKNRLLICVERGTSPKLSKNEEYLIATIKPRYSETREAKIKKKKSTDFPKDSLYVYDIKNNKQYNLGEVNSFKSATEFNNVIAYTQEINTTKISLRDTISNTKRDSTSTTKKNESKNTLLLIVHNLSTGDTSHIGKVDEYFISPNEKLILFYKKADSKEDPATEGLYLFDITSKITKQISQGKGIYKKITFDDHSQQIAFLADKGDEKAPVRDFKLYHFKLSQDSAKAIVDQYSANIPLDWYISVDRSLDFNQTGDKLFFGIAPIPPLKDTALVDFEHAKVDIWHWQDDFIMPQQLVKLKSDLSRSYDAILSLDSFSILPVIDDTFDRTVYTDSADQEWALASLSSPNAKLESQWLGYQPQDIYTISLVTGNRKLIKSDWVGNYYLSPDASYVILYDARQGDWYSYHILTDTWIHLNDTLTVKFADEQNDTPSNPSSYGIAAWEEGNQGVFIYDQFDIWYFSFDGNLKRLITKGYGRTNHIILRLSKYVKNTSRNKSIKITNKETLLLSAFNEKTKENGFYKLKQGKTNNMTRLVMSKHTYKTLTSSNDVKLYAYTKESFAQSPNVFITSDFQDEIQMSNINPQQENYIWGTSELVHWITPSGKAAEGILYKPENFDPNKKYPIIAYFYETLTSNLYAYQAPAPTPSKLNVTYFVSNGYLVFIPDIRYEIGHPGKSAEEYVNSGMKSLTKYNWVDSTKMGIQGQSWGGYQVAHLITRSDMYAAAWAGAPVVNMTSAYSGIRWQTGLSRQFQYEKTQSRIGTSLWDNLSLYIENSPLFFLDKVKTPVAIMHNDNDGAVPWYQGIEMFSALRRLGKPCWLLNYNGDGHNLMQRQNRKDIQIRQAQFFDHFLKGSEAPDWIKKGIPATKKGIHWGL